MDEPRPHATIDFSAHDDSFCRYLTKQLIAKHGFVEGAPQAAADIDGAIGGTLVGFALLALCPRNQPWRQCVRGRARRPRALGHRRRARARKLSGLRAERRADAVCLVPDDGRRPAATVRRSCRALSARSARAACAPTSPANLRAALDKQKLCGG